MRNEERFLKSLAPQSPILDPIKLMIVIDRFLRIHWQQQIII